MTPIHGRWWMRSIVSRLVMTLVVLIPACTGGHTRRALEQGTTRADSDSGVHSSPVAPDTSVESTLGSDESQAGAANVIRAYYRAIGDQRYRDAYRLWASDGAASGKSLEAFRSGFANTASVRVNIGTPGRIEGAAGSRFVEVPVHVSAVATDSTHQAFSGQYVLRRSVVDCATPDQRAWRIYSATIRREH
jgi:hypothetical protein